MTDLLDRAGRPGTTGRPALHRCVGIDLERFAREHWGRRPLLSRAAELPGDVTDLLTLDAVDELLSRRGLRTPFLRLARDGEVIGSGQFTGPGGAGAQIADQVRDEKVLRLFSEGATVVLQGLHRLWPPLIDFARQLGTELATPVQVNAYVTPASSRGFSAHYDVHDVFVLQVAGRKRWLVHEPVHPDPLRDQPWEQHREAVAAAARATPLLDEVLTPGDALYLPRGYLHSATALGETSAHLTVGLHTLTRHAIVEALCALAADTPELRAALPMGLDVADPDALAPHLADTVEVLAAQLRRADPAAVAERVRRPLWEGNRPEPLRPLAQAAALATLGPDVAVRLRHGLRCRLVDAGERVVLQLPSTAMSFAAQTAGALRVLLGGKPTAVRELPGLDAEDQVVLVRRLLREGVLVLPELADHV